MKGIRRTGAVNSHNSKRSPSSTIDNAGFSYRSEENAFFEWCLIDRALHCDMDDRSVRILKAIAALGTGSPDEIAAHTGIPKSTVHYRITKLEEDGILTNDLFDVDLEELGLEITVITEVIAEYDERYHKQVGEKLADIEGVNQVYFTMGDTDFVVIAHLADREMVHRLISDYERIDEIVRTSSQFVVETVKNESNPLNDFGLETLIETTTTD